MECRYEFNGQEMSYESLYNYISNNYDKIVSGSTDIIFSLEGKREIVKKQFDEIKAENIKTRKRSYSISEGEMYDASEGKYKDIHDLIEHGKKVISDEHYVIHYAEDELKNIKKHEFVEELKNQNIPENQIEQIANKKLDEFLFKNKSIEESGYHIHTIINLYFKGSRTEEDILNELRNINNDTTKYFLNNPNFLRQVIDGLKKTSKEIFQLTEHEEEDINSINFMANFPITSKIEGSENELYGNIDLIVLDKNGNPHIYLFKTSGKSHVNQLNVVNKKRDYYLAFYRQMLAAKGINVSKMSLNIVPMQIDVDINGNPNTINFERVENRTAVLNRNGINHLTYGIGRIHDEVSAVIPNIFNPANIEGSIKDSVNMVRDKFFPCKSLQQDKKTNEIVTFISKNVYPSTDPAYTWEFEDYEDNKIVRIKDSSDKNNNSEVIDKVTKYLQKKQQKKAKTLENFITGLKRVIVGKSKIHQLVSYSSNAAGYLSLNLDQYTFGDWVPLDFAALEELGILAIQNKITSQIDFITVTSDIAMNNTIQLGLGNTLLGDHEKNHVVGDNILKATSGNMDLIKTLIALNELCNKDQLSNLKIGQIKVINVNSGHSVISSTKILKNTFSSLCKATGTANNLDKLIWIDEFELLKNRFKSVLTTTAKNSSNIKRFYSQFEAIDPFSGKAALDELVSLTKEMEKQYSFLSPDWNKMIKESNEGKKRNIVNLYLLIHQTIIELNGGFKQPESMDLVGRLEGDNALNGRLATTPDAVKDRNILDMTGIVRQTFTVIRKNFSDFQEEFLHKTVIPFQKSKGYSHTQNMIIGNQVGLYRNLFREKDGKILPSMMFKNPYDPKEDLTLEERKFLKEVLWRINKRRFAKQLSGVSENSEQAKKLQQLDEWYWVPLVKAEFASKLTAEKIKDGIIDERKEIIGKLKTMKDRFKQNAEEIYVEADEKEGNYKNERYEMFNRFERSEADNESRQELLHSQNVNFWETNVENILLNYEYAFIRKEVLDRVLPIAKSLRLVTEAYGDLTRTDTKENVAYINNYLKQAAFSRTILSEEEKSFVGSISNMRQLTSFLMVAGNLCAPIRDVWMGVWKTIGLYVADTWGAGKGFSKQSYAKAMGIMLKDNIKSMAGITVCEALNQRFGIANVDIHVLAQRAKSGKTGICNFKDKLYWTATAGDYFNRMSILIAKMIDDGCYEACSYDEGFKYDWTKDKRFDKFSKNPNIESTDPKFLQQKGLYITMLREFNENGYNLKYGEPLPSPYTPLEITTIKTFADRMYGYYDQETRMQLEKTALGAIFLQFSTYITATKAKWMLPKGTYHTNERVQRKDENGKPLYWKIDKDANGNPIYIPTTENTGEPIMDVGETYMEGIMWTLVDFYKDAKNLGVRKAWGNIMDIKVKQQNLRSLAYTIFMWAILGNIVKWLIAMWGNERDKDTSPKTISKAIEDGLYDINTRGFIGSFADFNLLSAFGGEILNSEPPMVAMTTNLLTSTWGTVFGDRTVESWLKTNVAAYRSIRSFTQGVYEATQTSVELETL